MTSVCRRRDFLGRFCSYHLISSPAARRMSPMPSHIALDQTSPRIRLRFLANYWVMFYLLLFYFLSGLLSMGPLTCSFILLIGYLLYAAVKTLIAEKWKPHAD